MTRRTKKKKWEDLIASACHELKKTAAIAVRGSVFGWRDSSYTQQGLDLYRAKNGKREGRSSVRLHKDIRPTASFPI